MAAPIGFVEPTITSLPGWARRVAERVNYLLRRAADNADVGGLDERVSTIEATIADGLGAGFGFVDYSDTEIGTNTPLVADTPLQLTRSLVANPANTRLQGPWVGHQFWDDDDKLIRPRALYDVFAVSMFIRLSAGVLGGKLTVALVAGTLEFASKTVTLTAPVGEEERMRVDFVLPARTAFTSLGGTVMLTSTVTAELIEVSPEFFPLSYAA